MTWRPYCTAISDATVFRMDHFPTLETKPLPKASRVVVLGSTVGPACLPPAATSLQNSTAWDDAHANPVLSLHLSKRSSAITLIQAEAKLSCREDPAEIAIECSVTSV